MPSYPPKTHTGHVWFFCPALLFHLRFRRSILEEIRAREAQHVVFFHCCPPAPASSGCYSPASITKDVREKGRIQA